MTAAYLETSSRNLSNEVVLVIALTLCQLGICDGIRNLSAVQRLDSSKSVDPVNWENLMLNVCTHC